MIITALWQVSGEVCNASVGNIQPHTLRRAMLYGTVTASFCVEAFSIDRLQEIDRSGVEERFNEMMSFITL